MARDPVRDLAAQQAATLARNAQQDNTDSLRNLVDPITRLSINTGDLRNVQNDNLSEARYLRNATLQQTNVVNKLSESIKKADKINVKALGQSVTLEKMINKNSDAINDSSVGYLRAAEAFINNFAAGIRRTEGGTLRLTEQLILTGQDQRGFRDVNKNLLGATGRNYAALSEFNDSIIDSAKAYQTSTGELLKGLLKLQGDINQFALFGPEVAATLNTEFGKVLAEFQGLNEAQIGSFMKLGQGGLASRPTRELLGVQNFFNDMSKGAVASEDIRSNMISAGNQIAALTTGQDFDIAIETIAAKFRINQTDAANLVMLSRTLQAGADVDTSLLATNEEMAKTLETQKELSNRYYEKIAPQTLAATTNLLMPLLQISQAMNFFAAAQGFTKSGLNLAGGLIPKNTPSKFSGQYALKPDLQDIAFRVKDLNKKSTGAIKSLTRAFKDRMPKNFGAFLSSPMGMGAVGMGGQVVGQALGEESKSGQLINAAGQHLQNVAMARMIMPNLKLSKGLMVGGTVASVIAASMPMIKEGLKLEDKKGEFDAADGMDIGTRIAQGVAMGSMGFGVAGMVVGGTAGALYGLWEEYVDDWSKTSKSQLDIQKEEQTRARAAQKMRETANRSDYALMTILDGVRRQQDQLLASDGKKAANLLEEIRDLMAKRNRDAAQAVNGQPKANMNGN